MARDLRTSLSSTPMESTADSDTTTLDSTIPILTPATSVSDCPPSVSPKAEPERLRKQVTTSRRVTRSSLKSTELEAIRSEVAEQEIRDEAQNPVDLSDRHELFGGGEAVLNGAIDPKRVSPKRRSTRLSLLDKPKEPIGAGTSTRGKRTLDMISKSNEKLETTDRRASLRSRAPSSAPLQAPPVKKRRIEENTNTPLQETKMKQLPTKENCLIRSTRKIWLRHGLYAGQEHVDSLTPRLRKAKGDGNKAVCKSPSIFPLPMYAGARLLESGRNFKLPFDIFSPLPHGQPKPDEWRKTNKNMFVGDAALIWKANKHKEHSTCACTPKAGCDENCQNRFMFYECDDTNCKLGANLCHNRPFSELRRRSKAGGKFTIGVEVIKTEDRGHGVRSNRSFDPNQIIVEYTGEILTQEECERRMRTIYKKSECYYLMYFDQNMVIDATRGSIARFVNHSCEPNCRMEKWTVAGKPRMALFAGESGIMTGEELTYDYNFDPYSQKNVQTCRCGAPTCRGVLGPRPKDIKPKEKETPPKALRTNPPQKAGKPSDKARFQTRRKQTNAKPRPVKSVARKIAPNTRPVFKSAQAKVGSNREQTGSKASQSKTTEPEKRTARRSRISINSKPQTTNSGEKQPITANKKLRMPSKPRYRNSIAAARASDLTPPIMKKFLAAGGITVNSNRIQKPRVTRKRGIN